MAGLQWATDGNLYGTTTTGGQTTSGFGCGALFQITTATPAVLTVMHSLQNDTDGCGANAGLTLGPDGNFYGTAATGGGAGNGAAGTIFRLTPAGDFTRLFAFLPGGCPGCYPNGFQPVGEPVFDKAGNMVRDDIERRTQRNRSRHELEAVLRRPAYGVEGILGNRRGGNIMEGTPPPA